MPTIAVNLGAVVSSFSDLPFGSYLGEITKIKLLPPRQAGKFAQLLISYVVIDGDLLNRRQSQFMSLSPNAMGFVKDFFEKFGLGEIPDLIIDDDSEELTDPDLVGAKVIFKVAPDSKDASRTRVSLTSVEEWAGSEPTVAPARSIVKPPKALANQVEAEPVEDPAAAKAAAKAARVAAAQAALEAAAAEDDDEDEVEVAAPVAAAPVARTAAARPATTAAPARRTLR